MRHPNTAAFVSNLSALTTHEWHLWDYFISQHEALFGYKIRVGIGWIQNTCRYRLDTKYV